MATQPSRLVILVVLIAAMAVAVLLARPERIPDTTPPERSAQSRAPSVAAPPSEAVDPTAGESAGAEVDPPEPVAVGYALTRQDLETSLLKIHSRIAACGDEVTPKQVRVKLTILPSGAVGGVGLPPELRGSDAADCLAHALRTASFPAWSAPAVPSVEWTYPVRFDEGG